MALLSREAKVGIFLLLGILVLTYFTLRIGKMGVTERGYAVYATFETVAGLDEKSVVKMAGVPIGQVEVITLEKGKPRVKMSIREGVRIPVDSSIGLSSEGLLGEKYLEIYPGQSSEAVPKGGEIGKVVSGANLDELIRKVTLIADDVKKVTESLAEALGGKEGKASLKEMVENLRESTRALRAILADNEKKVGRILDNVEKVSADLREVTGEEKEDLKVLIANLKDFSQTLKERTPEIAEKLEGTLENVKGLVSENRESVKKAIENIEQASAKLDSTLGKIERGEGTIGKLVTDESAYENLNSALEGINSYITKTRKLQTYIDYRMEYLQEPSEFKHYASLKIQPTVDKYYLLGIVDDPFGKEKRTTTTTTTTSVNPPASPTTVTEEKVESSDQLKFTALLAKRFGDFTFKGGLIESTGGFGVSYHTLSDSLTLGLEAFDFGRENEDPHLKIYGNYDIFKNLFITAGYDDFLNSDRDRKSLFFGFGLTFRDEDLKTLLGAAPPVTP
ncbi:MAG: MCE family protein [Deltaproteobacteria bacterium]|nr:MAG: MCE family protein [Deltaproteobacteria bacterium]